MKPNIENNLLPITDCKIAIDNWLKNKCQFGNISNLIDPRNVMCFSKDNLLWMKSHAENNYFFMFAGIHSEKLVFIVAPVDSKGNLKTLESYLVLNATLLNEEIRLIEKINIHKVTTLTKDFTLLSETTTTSNLYYENDPSISEEKAVTRIQSWLEQSMDWFFCECNQYEGKRIFNSFMVPLFDLELNSTIEKVYCIFGFKESLIYNMLVPVINFIAVDQTSNQVQIQSNTNPFENGNIGDFSSPCPPFCRQKAIFPSLL